MDRNIDEEYAAYRKHRVQILKKVIKYTILFSILIPLVTAIVFIVLFVRTNREYKALKDEYAELTNAMEQLKDEISTLSEEPVDVYSVSEVVDSSRNEIVSEDIASEETEEQTEEDETEINKVYLTFDDGPSSNTDRILDILKEYDVKATFFVVGKTDATSVNAYKRIVEEGHTLGMHSYSHRYSQIYASKDAFLEDLNMLQEYLYDVTGVWSHYYRFPGGSSNTTSSLDMLELIDCLGELDISYFDWNIVSGDAVGGGISADEIYNNCVSGLDGYSNAMVLMHDAGNKDSTVDALPAVIEAIQARDNTKILPITDETIPVQHKKR